MITTVTTTTVAMISPLTAASLAMIAVLTLLVLLVKREIILSSNDERAIRLGLMLNVAIVPLLVGFLMTAVVKIASAME